MDYNRKTLSELIGYSEEEFRKELDSEEWVQVEDDVEERCVFIGRIFSIMPSGKCYMPWSTNVTEEEANKDEDWREAVEEKLGKLKLFIKSGEGDPTDLFVGESRQV